MVGPWGWAARMKREDLLIATAVLMGWEPRPGWGRPGIVDTMDPYEWEPAPDWMWAEMWLRRRGIEFTDLE